MWKYKAKLTLIGIFFIALILRTLWLETLPATFFVDEILSGYLGKYLWTNGMDLYGNPWPLLYFNKMGDYYIILPMYLDGISTLSLGLTRFATRLPTALIGALAVFPMYGVANFVFKKKTPALLASLLLAITPWHIVLSRATTESVIELTIVMAAVWSLLKSRQQLSYRWLFVGLLTSLISYLIYHTARMVIPLLWLGFLIIFYQDIKKNKRWLSLAIVSTLILFSLTFLISSTSWGRGRFEQTSLFSEQSGVSIRMQEMTYNLGSGQVLLARIFHNKLLGYSREFVNQYFSYFSPLFLFSDDAWLTSRYAVPEMGPLYVSLLTMILAYLIPSRKKLKFDKTAIWFVGWWLLIAPLPAALTVIESPNIRRSLLMLVPLVILSAGGWYKSFYVSWGKISLGHIISLLLIGEVILFSYLYVKQSDTLNSFYRSDVQPEIARYIVEHQKESELFLVFQSDDFPLYYLFETNNFSPELASQFHSGLRIEQIDQFKPMDFPCSADLPPELLIEKPINTIFIEPAACTVDSLNFEEIDRIYGVNQLLYYRVLKRII